MLLFSHVPFVLSTAVTCDDQKQIYQSMTCCPRASGLSGSDVCKMENVELWKYDKNLISAFNFPSLLLSGSPGPTTKATRMYAYGSKQEDVSCGPNGPCLQKWFGAPYSTPVIVDDVNSRSVMLDSSIPAAAALMEAGEILISSPFDGIAYTVPISAFNHSTDIAKEYDDVFGASTIFYPCSDKDAVFGSGPAVISPGASIGWPHPARRCWTPRSRPCARLR